MVLNEKEEAKKHFELLKKLRFPLTTFLFGYKEIMKDYVKNLNE
jgi:hypothetical protein